MLISQKRLKLRTSNLAQLFPGTVQTRSPKIFPKGAWPWSRDPLNFWALNAIIAQKRLNLRTWNLTKVFPGTVRTLPSKIFPKGGVARVTWPTKFVGVKCYNNSNNSKTIKATDFKFGTSVLRDSPNMTPKIFPKGAWPGSHDPLNFSALNTNAWALAEICTTV